jgi:ribosome-binding protein aMBF1 (putative translation factor)
MILETLSEIVMQDRAKSGLTIMAMSRKIEVNKSTIDRIEQRVKCPSAEKVERILNTLGYDIVIKKRRNHVPAA